MSDFDIFRAAGLAPNDIKLIDSDSDAATDACSETLANIGRLLDVLAEEDLDAIVFIAHVRGHDDMISAFGGHVEKALRLTLQEIKEKMS